MEDNLIKDEILIQALSKSADYSSNFDRVVEELCTKLSQVLGAKLFHSLDMNYISAQTIEIWLDKAHEPVSERSAASYKMRIFISSKGNFFATRCIYQDLTRCWRIIPNGERDKSVQFYLQRVELLLRAEGFEPLPQSVLSQRVDGHLTRLDKLPATVFQVLFSELG